MQKSSGLADEQTQVSGTRLCAGEFRRGQESLSQLDHALTLTDLTVISDKGALYSGPKAWLMCLWALRDYREWALRLSSPELLPTAKRVISMISQNRYQLEGLGSVVFRRAK